MVRARRFFVPLFLLAGALVSRATTLGQQSDESVEFRIGTSTGPTRPLVAVSADGSFVVTWIERGDVDSILGQRYDAAGRPIGDTFRVEDAVLLSRAPHSVAADGDGDFVVVWTSPGYEVQAQRFDSAGHPRDGSFEVSDFGYFDTAVAMSRRGDFVVVWADSPYNGTRARRYDAAGRPIGAGFDVSSGLNHATPVVAMRDEGSFVVAWKASFTVDAQRFDSAGIRAGDLFHIGDRGAARPSVDMASDGSFVAVWDRNGSGNLFGQRYDAAGQPAGAEFQIASGAVVSAEAALSVAVSDAGDFFVVWVADGFDVRGRHFDRQGRPIGPEFVVNSHRSGTQSAASAAIGANGPLVVAWNSASPDDAFDGLFGKRYAVASSAGGGSDGDGDGVPDGTDNCPTVANPEQIDVAGDGFGDDCVWPDFVLPSTSSFGRNPVIGVGTIVFDGVRVGDDANLGEHVRLDRLAVIGDRFTAGDFVVVGRRTTIGDDVAIGFATRVEGGVRIGSRVTIGDDVLIKRNAVVGDDATIDALAVIAASARIGAGATIEMGARIGRGATVRPGAVVPAGTAVGPGVVFP